MPFTARIFRHLESEMNRNLGFGYTIEQNISRPDSRTIRPGDRFRLRLFVTNGCSLKVEGLHGAVRPTRWVDFEPVKFRVDSLGSREQAEIGRVVATIKEAPQQGSIFDQLATIDVAGRADLSAFRFSDTRRPVTYARVASAAPAARPTPAPAARWVDAFDGPAST